MRTIRSWLGPCLAVLLLLQWLGGPAHCLNLAAPLDDAICHAEPAAPGNDHGDHTPGHVHDQDCPACQAFTATILPQPSLAPPRPVVWTRAVLHQPLPTATAPQPPTSPTQPRAPPSLA